MMHRDLKSPNVLLSEEGVAKIAVRPHCTCMILQRCNVRLSRGCNTLCACG